MKFGIYSSIADPPAGENLALRVDEVVAEAKLAESVGFDSCFFGEHHQDKDGFLPSPLIVSAAVAAQTTRLKLGTSVILLPLHHPVRLAEDVITLDIVSRGRFILGVGLGYQPVDFRTFDIPVGQRVSRFEEGLRLSASAGAARGLTFPASILSWRTLPSDPNHTPTRRRRCGLARAGFPARAGRDASPTDLWPAPAPTWTAP